MIHRIEFIANVTASGWGEDKYKYDTRKCKVILEEVEDSHLTGFLKIVGYEEVNENN